jgi:hypothetical protein
MLGLLVIALMTVGAVAVAQTTWYVDATNGLASNDGKAPTQTGVGVGPKQNITQLLPSLADGDIINIAVGTYTDEWNLNKAVTINGYIPSGSTATSVVFVSATNPYEFSHTGTVVLKVGAIGSAGPTPATRIDFQTTGLNHVRGVKLTSGVVSFSTAEVRFSEGVTITRVTGSLAAAPTFVTPSVSGYSLVYLDPGVNGSLNAGPEVPPNFRAGKIRNERQQFRPLTFPSTVPAINMRGVGGGGVAIENTSTGDMIFNVPITITKQSIITNNSTGNITINADVTFSPSLNGDVSGRLVNAGNGNIIVNGNVNFNLRAANTAVGSNGNVIDNQGTGTLRINGNVTFAKASDDFNTPNERFDEDAVILNNSTGTLEINGIISDVSKNYVDNTVSPNVTYTQYARVKANNASTGTMRLGNSAGTSALRGNTDLSSCLVNSGTVVLNGNLNLGHSGVTATNNTTIFTNNASSVINVQGFTLSLVVRASAVMGGYTHTVVNNGNITGTGTVKNAGTAVTGATDVYSWTGNGALPSYEHATSRPITFANLDGDNKITGNLVFSSSGSVTFTLSPAINGNVTLPSGTLNISNGQTLIVKGNFTHSGGTLVTNGTGILEMRGNYTRTAGTYTKNTGKFKFTGASNQTFSPGAQLALYDLEVATQQSAVLTLAQSVEVQHDVILTSGRMDLSTYNIRMTGSGGTVNNTSGYQSSGGGSIVFENTGFLSGAGTYSNIEINVTGGGVVDVKDIGAANETITISGVLTLRNGNLRYNTDAATNTSIVMNNSIVKPTIRKNTNPTDAGTALIVDAGALGGGSFTIAPGETYNLLYFGDANYTVGTNPEWVAAQLNDVTVQTGPGTRTVTIPGSPVTIAGAIYVYPGQTLDLNAQTVTSTGSVTHNLYGTVSNGTLKITGDNVTLAGLDDFYSLTPTAQNVIDNLTIDPVNASTATITINNLYGITGNFSHLGGNTTITMGSAGDLSTDVTRRTITGAFSMSGGTLTLGARLRVGTGGANAYSHNGGTIALGANRLIYAPGLSAGFSVSGTASYTYTSTSGRVVIAGTAPTLQTEPSGTGGTVPVPNLEVSVSASFTGNVEVSNFFLHSGGTLNIGNAAYSLIISGGQYFEIGSPTVTGPGWVRFKATSTLGTDGGNYSLPNVQIDPGSTGTVSIRSYAPGSITTTSTTARTVTVTGTLTLTSGTLDLERNDVQVNTAVTRPTGGTTITALAGSASTATNTDGVNRGELVLAGATVTPGSGFTVPNVRITTGGATLTGNSAVTVTGYFQFGQGGSTTPAGQGTGSGNWALADGAWIIRDGTGTLDAAPIFGATTNVYYTATAAYTTGLELPSTVNNLTVNTAGTVSGVTGNGSTVTLATNKAITVNGTLRLTSGLFAITTNTGSTVTMADGATIAMTALGNIDANGTEPAPIDITNSRLLRAGSIKLNYFSFPGQAIALGTPAAPGGLRVWTMARTWPSTATVTELSITLGDGVNVVDYQFQLSRSRTVGSLVVNTGTALSQVFIGDDGSAGGVGVRTLTVTGATTINNGRVTTEDAGTGTSISTLALQGNLTMTGGVIGGTATGEQGLNLSFTGTGNQTVSLSSNQTVGQVTINQTGTNSTVTVTGANLALTGNLVLINGVVLTGATNSIVLPAGVQGFDRSGLTGVSHVAGRVTKAVVLGRNEFPTGSATQYRPVALTFATNPGVNVTISHVDTKPTGIVGLPIADGVSPGVDIARYAPFYWNISSNISLGSTQFNLELTAAGFTDFDDVANIRIIRRAGSAADVGNQWRLQGVNYDNFVAAGVPTVVNVNSTGGILPEGAIFTYGLKSNMVVANPFTIPTLTDAAPTFRRYLRNPALITGNTGALSFTASAANPAIVDVSLSNDTLIVTRKVTGTTTVTVVATDAADGSRISYTTSVNVISKVETIAGAVPTEFSLEQNFPNPFNPSTTIRFALPKEAPVTLVIYNMLGVPVRTLINGEQLGAANHQVTWDGKDDAGMTVPSGMYLYRITAGSFQATRKMTLLK